MIEGVILEPLAIIEDQRGAVMHMFRSDSPHFHRFGEIYFSVTNPGVVKGWKRHSKKTQHIAVPHGKVKFVIFDSRPGSSTKGSLMEIELGRPDNYQLLVIPAGVWYGFQGMSPSPTIIANCTDMPHDPSEAEQINIHSETVPYQWQIMSKE